MKQLSQAQPFSHSIHVAMVAAMLWLAHCASGDEVGGKGTQDEDIALSRSQRARTFDSVNDFMGAASTFSGINAVPPGQLQVNVDQSVFETPFLWVANSTQNTVSQIDVMTRKLVGTYPLVLPNGEECYNPSRTSVDIDGDVWVGCRGTSSYMARDQLAPSMVPVQVDNKVMKLSRTDGHILLSLKVGHAPRGLALDARNHLWIACSVDDTVWEMDGDTGACYRGENPDCAAPPVRVGRFPYGAAVDQRGHLWVVTAVFSHLLSDIPTQSGVETRYGPFVRKNGCMSTYGIAIDPLNNIWIGGQGCSDVFVVKGVTGVNPADQQTYRAGQMIASYPLGGTNTRGIAVDLKGNVWAASSGTDTITKINGATGKIIHTVNVGVTPIGVGVDAYGNAWAVNQTTNNVYRINGLDPSKIDIIDVGVGPYTYSDMLGTSLRAITYRGDGFTNWKTKIDSGVANPKWTTLRWEGATPGTTALQARSRCAATEEALDTAPWGALLTEPGSVDCAGKGGRWIQVEVRFYQNGSQATPVLKNLTVLWDT